MEFNWPEKIVTEKSLEHIYVPNVIILIEKQSLDPIQFLVATLRVHCEYHAATKDVAVLFDLRWIVSYYILHFSTICSFAAFSTCALQSVL